MSSQLLPALIASLLAEGVTTSQIEAAVSRAVSIPPGGSISDHNALHRAFAFEQSRLLERKLR